MTTKSVPAAINETAFDCPHCGAYTTQFWYSLNAKQLDENRPTPLIPSEDATKDTLSRGTFTAEQRENVLRWFKKMDSRLIWMNPDGKDSPNAFGRPVRQDRTGASGNDVGEEIDVVLNAHLTDRQDVFVQYAHFFPGGFIRATGPSRPGQAVYVQYSWRW